MVKCKWCKKKTRTNYYLLKFNGKIVAHFCSALCLSGWADYEAERKTKPSQQTALYDHQFTDDTSEKKEVIMKHE